MKKAVRSLPSDKMMYAAPISLAEAAPLLAAVLPVGPVVPVAPVMLEPELPAVVTMDDPTRTSIRPV